MPSPANGFSGHRGRVAFVDLGARTVRVETPDPALYRDYLGGRGVQARLLYDHVKANGPVRDPLDAANRIVVGNGPVNDTHVATAGRGSCSFIGTMTRSPEPASWMPAHAPLHGLLTHASAGGLFPNMLKRAGFDHIVIDGRASGPVRLLVVGGQVEILDAEDDLFETAGGARVPKKASALTDVLAARHPGSSTVCLGPAGWNRVAFACLTNDKHRNFGRGGAGAVFGSKKLVAITALGRDRTGYADQARFQALSQELDAQVKAHVGDAKWTASFRPEAGTTWWLDRAFNGGYLGKRGGYLPWHNFDEGSFDSADYAKVGTKAFLEISGPARVCNQCRHVMCTRAAKVDRAPYAGSGVRPEFETIALWINCCILDRDAIFHLNYLCNELGVDTMTLGSVMAGAMELAENGYLSAFKNAPAFGSAPDMIRTLEEIAYRSSPLGELLGGYSDRVVAGVAAGRPAADLARIARCVTTAFGGLGYAGIEPKVFPGMFTAYATSNRGRGDHTYAWTIQAEEGGLQGAEDLAAYVAAGQEGKAIVDSLGLCDFFTEDVASDLFLGLYRALTGFEYAADAFKACGRRIYALERRANVLQGRGRAYDAHVPAKMTEPLTRGAHAGRAIDPAFHRAVLDAYYRAQGWTAEGDVVPDRLRALGLEP
jgi:aldehyde:ferredoxin oxidoreductase